MTSPSSSSDKQCQITVEEADLLYDAVNKAVELARGAFFDFGVPVPEILERAAKVAAGIQERFDR